MKTYKVKENKKSFSVLKTRYIKDKDYICSHKSVVIPCIDLFIKYNGGILLVNRLRYPSKGMFWSIGGRVQRGISIEASAKLKAKKECNLKIKSLKLLDCIRYYSNADPYKHGKGTDNISFVYLAEGYGKLKLDKLHEEPIIVTPRGYNNEFRDSLNKFTRDFMDIAIKEC